MTARELIATLEALPEDQKDLPVVGQMEGGDYIYEIVPAHIEVKQCAYYEWKPEGYYDHQHLAERTVVRIF